MKCTHCGAELAENATLCESCGTPVEAATKPVETAVTPVETEEASADSAEVPAETTVTTPPDPQKKSGKKAAIIIAAVAAIAIAAFAAFKLTAKDPKEVVIAAFENVWSEDQVSPSEELFGTSELAKAMTTTDSETSLSLKLDSCSEESVNNFAGAGLRISGKNDITNKKSSFNMGVTYNDMDAANLDFYYGDDTLMVALPELVSRVFTLDLSDGLADRVKNSPTVGTYLAQNGVDIDAMAAYLQELMDEAATQAEEGTTQFDLDALMTRYREGCKAKDNFKATLVVEKDGKGSFTMDGKEVSCTGYHVTVSKDSMIEFLRLSSDFFLQDEMLRQDFLKQLEASVRMSELMGAGAYGGTMQTPEELQQQAYDEAKSSVDEMITYLDDSLTDVQMTVYVDKAGRLASVSGTTAIHVNMDEAATAETAAPTSDSIAVAFQWNLQGGAYLTQNMNGNITLSDPDDEADNISIAFTRQGTYDKNTLTDDVSIDFNGGSTDLAANERTINLMYTSSYSAADGSFHVGAELGLAGSQLLNISGTGVVDELEKGKSFHLTIDELTTSLVDDSMNIVLSGEYSMSPLESEIVPLEGDQMDVLAATEEDWQGIFLEGLFGAMAVMQELGIQ